MAEDDKKWSEKSELKFLQILYERVKKDPKGTPTFKQTDWKDIEQEMFLASGERIVRAYRSHLPINLESCNAPEDVWQMFYQKHANYRTFRDRGCPHYELLGQVFNKSTATGHLSHSSSQLPPTSDEERQTEGEYMSRSVHIDTGDGAPYSGSSHGKRPYSDALPAARRAKKGNSSKMDAC